MRDVFFFFFGFDFVELQFSKFWTFFCYRFSSNKICYTKVSQNWKILDIFLLHENFWTFWCYIIFFQHELTTMACIIIFIAVRCKLKYQQIYLTSPCITCLFHDFIKSFLQVDYMMMSTEKKLHMYNIRKYSIEYV